MRYYYNDSLIAAYMAYTHGIRFYRTFSHIFNYFTGDDLSTFESGDKNKLYIASDSLKALEPIERDLVQDDVDTYIFRHSAISNKHGNTRIIQRNGKLFFYPEIEMT